MQCRSLSAQLGRHYPDFQAANTQVFVILGEDIERSQEYAELLKLPFPVLADPERQVYHRYELHKAFIVIQRSAVVLIDQEGLIQYFKAVTNPMAWLSEYEQLHQEILNAKVENSQQ